MVVPGGSHGLQWAKGCLRKAEQAARVRVGYGLVGVRLAAHVLPRLPPSLPNSPGGDTDSTAGIGFEFADLVTRLIRGDSEHTLSRQKITDVLIFPGQQG